MTSAKHATAYIWSSPPVAADGASTLWWVPPGAPGLSSPEPFDGLGLRGNDSTPMLAENVVIPESNLLGEDGGGLGLMLETVLPYFNAMTAACAIGFMEAAVGTACRHASTTTYEHLSEPLVSLPTIRASSAARRAQSRCATPTAICGACS